MDKALPMISRLEAKTRLMQARPLSTQQAVVGLYKHCPLSSKLRSKKKLALFICLVRLRSPWTSQSKTGHS